MSIPQFERIIPVLYSELQNGYITPGEYAFISDKYLLKKDIEKYGREIQCYYYEINYSCGYDEWPGIIKRRRDIGVSIYLDQDDYILYQRDFRHLPPWIEK